MDLYALRGISLLWDPAPGNRGALVAGYWAITLAIYAGLLWAGSRFRRMRDPSLFIRVMWMMGIFLMVYLPKLLFNAFQLLGDVAALVVRLVNIHGASPVKGFLFAGGILGILVFAATGWGMLRGRTRVKVFRECLEIPGLPEAFSGTRIVQISDLHLAGFYHQRDHIEKVVSRINALGPDLILFTGDMVHNFSEELDPFTGILAKLQSPLGKFAILGNHDYGHYFPWGSESEKEANLERLKEQIRSAGFDLLLNEHRTLSVNGVSIRVIGVENWGKPPFPQRGDLAKAMAGISPEGIRILMSHDPSHWDLKVRGREQIELTLSGHTHGMQFGIEIGKFRWSPSRWTYRHWAGLYRENGQYLYVNRGLGFTGFPGRVGIRPEITLLTLYAPPASAH
jgi:predicted MPP superfamily phosphohydrolase